MGPDFDDLRGSPRRPLWLSGSQGRPTAGSSPCLPASRHGQFQRSQATVPDGRFGPLQGQLLHFSFGTGSHFLVLRDKVDGQPQGAAVPLPGEFLSGAHRGRFSAQDGQLYVAGMAGWGTYTPADASFQRVRYTGGPVQLPMQWRAHENGVELKFRRPLAREFAGQANRHFAQAWNYHYSASYGSPELSIRHPGQPGHDPLAIRSAHVLADGQTLFLEIPDLQPVNQLHLHVSSGEGEPTDIFATVNRLAAPFTGFPGYVPSHKTIAAHPILADMEAPSIRLRLTRGDDISVANGRSRSRLART